VDARVEGRRLHVLHLRQFEGRLGEADAALGAAEAGVAGAHRPGPGAHVAEQDGGAVGVGLRPLAAELVEAPPLAVALVAELQGETAGVEVGAALAVLVDEPGVGKLGAGLRIEIR
jgi:hypothetical protein